MLAGGIDWRLRPGQVSVSSKSSKSSEVSEVEQSSLVPWSLWPGGAVLEFRFGAPRVDGT